LDGWKYKYISVERRNLNRGFKKLEVWQDAIELYVLVVKHFSKLPFAHQKSASNTIDAAHSVIRNIAEGYCRKGLKEYLNFLYFALGSCGELHSACIAFQKAGLISENIFEEIDAQHYKVENKLIKLVESLQKKNKSGEWSDSFIQSSTIPSIQSSNSK
jgi:four helix bundle protein